MVEDQPTNEDKILQQLELIAKALQDLVVVLSNPQQTVVTFNSNPGGPDLRVRSY